MPMPSVVWDYFDEFEGGGKCRLCGCIRNRKDKSTSTFWQHLERVHGLDKRQMLVNSATNNVPCGKLNSNPRPPTTPTGNNANNPIPSPSGKRSSDSIKLSKEDEELTDKMPKLELMADLLDQQATEETFKFISELVKQQQQPMPEAIVSTNPVIEAALEKEREMPAIPKMGNGIFPIGISLNSLEDKEVAKRIFEQIEPTTNQVKDTKNADYEQTPPAEPSPPSLNNESTGSTADLELLDRSSLSPKTSSSCPSKSSPTPPPNKHFLALAKTKNKSPSIAESTADDGKKRMDFINWDEFFMGTAILAAQRSKDPATQVGACIVRENIIVAIGYNGMPIGCPDDEMPWGKCDEDPLKTKYPFVCHAEMNAIMNKNFANLRGATLYTTMFPCNECAKLIIQSQIKRVVFLKTKEGVQMTASRRLLDITGIEYSKFEPIRSEVLIRFN